MGNPLPLCQGVRAFLVDNLSLASRRKAMRAVRGKRTLPEVTVARALRALRVRFRRHPALPGNPDFVLLDSHAVLFVHGCFWHSHGCRPPHRHQPRTNAVYWRAKLLGNQRRDARSRRILNRLGWKVLVVWE